MEFPKIDTGKPGGFDRGQFIPVDCEFSTLTLKYKVAKLLIQPFTEKIEHMNRKGQGTLLQF